MVRFRQLYIFGPQLSAKDLQPDLAWSLGAEELELFPLTPEHIGLGPEKVMALLEDSLETDVQGQKAYGLFLQPSGDGDRRAQVSADYDSLARTLASDPNHQVFRVTLVPDLPRKPAIRVVSLPTASRTPGAPAASAPRPTAGTSIQTRRRTARESLPANVLRDVQLLFVDPGCSDFYPPEGLSLKLLGEKVSALLHVDPTLCTVMDIRAEDISSDAALASWAETSAAAVKRRRDKSVFVFLADPSFAQQALGQQLDVSQQALHHLTFEFFDGFPSPGFLSAMTKARQSHARTGRCLNRLHFPDGAFLISPETFSRVTLFYHLPESK